MSTSASLAAGVPAETAPNTRIDVSTVEQMFDRCCAGLYRYIALRVGYDRTLADELMQQLWLQACKSHRAMPPEDCEYWLRSVAKNLINDHWRRKHRRPAHLGLEHPEVARELASRLDAEVLPSAELEKRETLAQLALAVTALPSEDQDLIVLHYVQCRSFEDIGAVCGMSERAVEGRLYRARQKLKHMLAHLEEAV